MQKLKSKCKNIRKEIFLTAVKSGKGHIPPALSWVEIAVCLFYKKIINISKKNINSKNRDYFILSKGHGCLTLYSILSDLKFIKKSHLKNFARGGSLLPGHPDHKIPGVDICTGSLGHGLGVGCGFAISKKLENSKNNIFVLIGDGELHEGSTWESIAFASSKQLNNLKLIIDRNRLISTNFTEKVLKIEPLKKKLSSFGWNVYESDGHDLRKIINCFSKKKKNNKPSCFIFNTIKGKGIKMMENSSNWHHQRNSSYNEKK